MTGSDVEQRPRNLPVPVPGAPVRKLESEAFPARMLRGMRRNKAVSVPAMVPPAAWMTAEFLHHLGMGPEIGFAGAAASAAVWLFAPLKWTKKDGTPQPAEVWYARASAVCGSGWLTAAALLGPVSGSGPALAGSLVVLSAAWGVPWYRHYRIRGRKDRERLLREWQAWWDGHALAWGAGGSHVIDAEDKGPQVRLRVQLIRGRQSLLVLKGSLHLIESAAAVDAGMVRIAAVKGDASQADVFVKQDNPLREVVEWDPALAPSSVHDLVFRGLSETGQRVMLPQRTSAFVNGKTGSGKSNNQQVRIAELSGCADARAFVIDLKQRNARPLLKSGAVDWVITDPDEAGAALRMLCAEIAARSREWDTGTEQALADKRTPALFALVDETRPLTSDIAGKPGELRAGDLGTVASTGRAVEIYTEVVTQYGSLAESVGTEQTRMNLPLRICFAVEYPAHGVFALGEGGGDASKLEEQGEYLMKLGPRAKMEKVRAPHMPHSLLEQVCADNGRRIRKYELILFCGNEPSGIGGMTWQEWYSRRHLRIHPKFRGISPQYEAAVEEFGEPRQAGRASAADPAPLVRPYLAPVPPMAEDGESGAAVAARIAAETSGPDLAPSPDARARAAEIYAQSEEKFFALLGDAPPAGIRKAELIERSGVSNGQGYKILGQLAERGAVTEPARGMVAPAPGRDAAAEYAAIRAGNDALGRRAEKRLQSVG
jgi:hypothetical protein